MFTNNNFVTKWASAFLFLTFLAIGFTSCEEDEPDPNITITCPADVTSASGNVTIPIPTVSGASGNFTITNDVTGTSDASGTYAAGTTTVTYTVTDDTTGDTADAEHSGNNSNENYQPCVAADTANPPNSKDTREEETCHQYP